MQNFDARQTEAALHFPVLIDRLDKAFAGHAEVPLRHTHKIRCGDAEGTTLIMPAWSDAGYFGIKVINIFDRNADRGLPGLHAIYNLFDARTGIPLASIDGDVITGWRTAGAAALGARYLAAEDASTLLIVGSGRIASLLYDAMSAVRPIRRVLVWSRTFATAEKLAATLRRRGVEVTAMEDLEQATRQADIVSCATLASQPLIQREWLKPGSHLDLIGSFRPDMTEAAPECFSDAMVYVDTAEAPLKSGDLLNALASGHLRESDIRGTLTQLARGEVDASALRASGRATRTVFKAVGSAVEDLTAATIVYEAARAKGIA